MARTLHVSTVSLKENSCSQDTNRLPIDKPTQDNLTQKANTKNPCLRTAGVTARRGMEMEVAERERMLYPLSCAYLTTPQHTHTIKQN